jgi:hypothetical protein
MKPGDLVSLTGKIRVAVDSSEVRGWVEYEAPRGGSILVMLVDVEKTVGCASREDAIETLNRLGWVSSEQLTESEIKTIRKRLDGKQKKSAPKASKPSPKTAKKTAKKATKP